MKRASTWFAVGLAVCLLSQPVGAKPAKVDRASSQRAMSALLAASDDVIPETSSCHGLFGGGSPGRVRDLVAMEFATLSRGRNVVIGHCDADEDGRCSVSITHDFGEEVSSADIRFKTLDGRAIPESLDCVLTP